PLQLCSREQLELLIRRSERLNIQISNYISLVSATTKTRQIAAQRQAPTIIDVHAHTRQRRARRTRLVDIVVTHIDPDIHLEDPRENRNLLFNGTLLLKAQ